MFWVVAAPIPARAKAQRAATQGDEEVTAAANWPVRGQRARSEKVMFRLLLPAHLAAMVGFVKHIFLTAWFGNNK
jgi:anti-sigma factor RsiW